MGRASRDEWSKRVERWRESGLSGEEFATEIGVNTSSLRNWGWRLAAEKRRGERRPSTKSEPLVEFIEVVSPAIVAPPISAGAVFEVVLASGATVRVPSGFDGAALRRLLDAVGR